MSSIDIFLFLFYIFDIFSIQIFESTRLNRDLHMVPPNFNTWLCLHWCWHCCDFAMSMPFSKWHFNGGSVCDPTPNYVTSRVDSLAEPTPFLMRLCFIFIIITKHHVASVKICYQNLTSTWRLLQKLHEFWDQENLITKRYWETIINLSIFKRWYT